MRLRDANPRVLCVGSLCMDTLVAVPQQASGGELQHVDWIQNSVGGCCGNAAIALSRMGAKVGVAARTANDPTGMHVRRFLGQSGVDLVVPVAAGTTSRSIVLIDADSGNRRFWYAEGTGEDLAEACLESLSLHAFDALLITDPFLAHFGYQELASLCKRAKSAGLTTAMDLCWDPSGQWGIDGTGLPGFMDLILGNGAEISSMTGRADPFEAARTLVAAGASAVMVKLGTDGLVCAAEGRTWCEPAITATCVDPTGAGDWCAAGSLMGYLMSGSMERASMIGALAGAAAVGAIGGTGAEPTPELRAALRDLTLRTAKS